MQFRSAEARIGADIKESIRVVRLRGFAIQAGASTRLAVCTNEEVTYDVVQTI